ncbi:MAG: ribonuclease P protein component [Bacteroidales bacterium]|nr:ribonuclease P protein component [Bacteroidales bacterium]MBN2758172.1 ribonuclease P protein component [Bacteroidales bacterium]
MNLSYKKVEKLCSKTEISDLFAENKIVSVYPVKIVWRKTKFNTSIPVKSVISVSKRRFKRAVDRNLLKRRLRESFRKNKHSLYQTIQNSNYQVAMMIIYQSNEKLPFLEIEQALQKALQKLIKKLENL